MSHGGGEDNLNGNLTAMIDVVFQLIIFFVCTTNLQNHAIEDRVRLALAPFGKEIKVKNPAEVPISVTKDGNISQSGSAFGLTLPQLTAILNKAKIDSGGTPPVVIRADIDTPHRYVRDVMNACKAAGIWKIKIQAFKDKVDKGNGA